MLAHNFQFAVRFYANRINIGNLTVGPLIGRYCGIKVPPVIQSSTGILSLSFHTDMAVAKDGFSVRYNMTHKDTSERKFYVSNEFHFQIKHGSVHHILFVSTTPPIAAFHCSNPFGMESGKITDEQITASSSFGGGQWQPHQARLNYNYNGWTPEADSNREYIQV